MAYSSCHLLATLKNYLNLFWCFWPPIEQSQYYYLPHPPYQQVHGQVSPPNENKMSGSPGDKDQSTWVRFEEEAAAAEQTTSDATTKTAEQYSGAVIQPETAHVSLDRSVHAESPPQQPLHVVQVAPLPPASADMRTVDLGHGATVLHGGVSAISTARQQHAFVNGDIIVTLLPVNTRWPWITPAKFRPELVPEELMAQGLTLTVEDYVQVMELLTHDVRFSLYNVCYKRVLALWVMLAFTVLIVMLFSGFKDLTLFGLGVLWLIINAAAIVICMWIKIKLNHNLERCFASVNRHLLRHKIIVGLDDRGKLSCHKVNLCFIYFDTAECVKKLQEVIDSEERVGRVVGREETAEERRHRQQLETRMDIDDSDIIIQGTATTRLSRKQGRAEMLLLRYSQRWAKLFVRKLVPLQQVATGGSHCLAATCPCLFIGDHLKYKPNTGETCGWCAVMTEPHFVVQLP